MALAMFILGIIILSVVTIHNFCVTIVDDYPGEVKFPILAIALAVLAIINFVICG